MRIAAPSLFLTENDEEAKEESNSDNKPKPIPVPVVPESTGPVFYLDTIFTLPEILYEVNVPKDS